MSLRPPVRKLAYASGALSLVRQRQRRALTVLMLHRVLEAASTDLRHADPEYTLSTTLFEALLGFVQQHYNVVGLSQVLAAHAGQSPLPDWALLITFDDGWADNLRCAAPLLVRCNLPAVVFAVPDAILAEGDEWWQERIFAAARTGTLKPWLEQPACRRVLACGGPANDLPPLEVVTALGHLQRGERETLLQDLGPAAFSQRMMLQPQDLRKLVAMNIDVGLHGYSHMPLTKVRDVADELRRASESIDAMSDGTATVTALGCPHGRYDNAVVAAAHEVGIKLVFTSDPHLNATEQGLLQPDGVLGRINVVGQRIVDKRGTFDPSAAARWLWAREIRR